MTIDYTKSPTETIDQYNARIAAANTNLPAPGTTSSTGVTNTAGANPPTYTADSLKNPNALWQIGEAPTTPNYGASLSSIPSIESIVNDTVDTTTAADTTKKTLQDRVLGVLDKLTGKTAAQQTAENAAGLPDLTKQLNHVNAQIQTLQKEASAVPLQVQEESIGRGRTEAGVAPIETSRLRQNTIKALGLSAIAQTLQGNVSLAQQQADRAVALEFDPLQSELDYLKQALDFNASDMSAEEQKQATILQAKLQERQDALNQQKSDRTTVLGYVLQAAQLGAPASILSQAQNLSPEAAIALLGPYLKDKSNYINVGSGSTLFDSATGKPVFTAPNSSSGGGASYGFSTTQVNTGASHAGLSSEEFKQLPGDVQNLFVSNADVASLLVNDVADATSGDMTREEALQDINDQNVPESVKEYFTSLLPAAKPASSGGGFWDWLGSFFSG